MGPTPAHRGRTEAPPAALSRRQPTYASHAKKMPPINRQEHNMALRPTTHAHVIDRYGSVDGVKTAFNFVVAIANRQQ
jgi:hypothetical protein